MDNLKAEYLKSLVDHIVDEEQKLPEDKRIDSLMLSIWYKKLSERIDETMLKYVIGERDHYTLSTEEFEETYNDAGMEYCEVLLDKWLEDDLIHATIENTGDILYGLSKKGKNLLKSKVKSKK